MIGFRVPTVARNDVQWHVAYGIAFVPEGPQQLAGG